MSYYTTQENGATVVMQAETPPPGWAAIPEGLVDRVFKCVADDIPFRVVDDDLDEGSSIPHAAPSVWDWGLRAWIDPRSVSALRSDVLRALKGERDRRINGGFVWGGSRFDSDASARLSLLELSARAQAAPTGFQENWRLANNTWRRLSKADARETWAALQAHRSAHYQAFKVKEDEVSALTAVEALHAYPLTVGWPLDG